MISALETLVARWQKEAELLRRRGAGPQAEAALHYAQELEETVAAARLESLTLTEAARESGYSAHSSAGM